MHRQGNMQCPRTDRVLQCHARGGGVRDGGGPASHHLRNHHHPLAPHMFLVPLKGREGAATADADDCRAGCIELGFLGVPMQCAPWRGSA